MQYRIIHVTNIWSPASAVEKLTAQVNAAIADGWEPLGGVCIHATNYCQALVKRR